MRKFLLFLITSLLWIVMTAAVYAGETWPLMVDDADLLTDSEEWEIDTRLREVSDRYNMDVVILTVWDLDGKSAMEYADDYYDEHGYRSDGILLLISMEERDWWISTTGEGIRDFTDAGLEYISDIIVPLLSEGDYEQAFVKYITLCEDFVQQARNGTAYDYGNLPKEGFAWGKSLVIAFGIGFLVALITVLIMKRRLKSVRRQESAAAYTSKNSLQLTEQRDRFLYMHHSRTVKPKNQSGGSSSHRSSSGSSHGGRGGKF